MNPPRFSFVWGIRVKLGVSSQNVSNLLPIPTGIQKEKKNTQANT